MDAEELAAHVTSDEARNTLLNMLLARLEQTKTVESCVDMLVKTPFEELTPQAYVEFLSCVPMLRTMIAESLEMNTRAASLIGDVDVAKLLAERLLEE